MDNKQFTFLRLNSEYGDVSSSLFYNYDEIKVLKVLQETDNPEFDIIVHRYFENKWLGYGAFNNFTNKLIGYCFVKHPNERPETSTVVHSYYRNLNIGTLLRNYVIDDCIKYKRIVGNIIYSACNKNNIPSLKSLLNSGYKIITITEDNNIQLEYHIENGLKEKIIL